jgi:small neutral amino acid transporter SnatA (MarC family)
VINPLGTIPVFAGLTKDNLSKENNRIAQWAASIPR